MEAAQAPDFAIQLDTQDKPTTAYVFFAMDTIAPDVKHKNPGWARGGALRPDFRTLGHLCGYIERGRVTELRQTFESELASNIDPNKRQHMPKTYKIQENGASRTVGTKIVKDQDTGEKAAVHDGLLRHAIFPQEDLDILTGQIDGIVKMPISSRAEAAAAEAFLYPNGESLPKTVAATRSYFESRRDAARSAFELAVANAALLSVAQYETKALGEIDQANSDYDKAKANGWGWSYGPPALMAFDQLGIPRRDNVDRSQQDRLDQMSRDNKETQNALAGALNTIGQILQGQQKTAEPQNSVKTEDLPADIVPTSAEVKEIANQMNEDFAEPFTIGQKVLVAGVEGKVIAKPFGKIKVETAEGTTIVVEKNEVTAA
jgi:hypothetical protein